jgi:hypothetical protein
MPRKTATIQKAGLRILGLMNRVSVKVRREFRLSKAGIDRCQSDRADITVVTPYMARRKSVLNLDTRGICNT